MRRQPASLGTGSCRAPGSGFSGSDLILIKSEADHRAHPQVRNVAAGTSQRTGGSGSRRVARGDASSSGSPSCPGWIRSAQQRDADRVREEFVAAATGRIETIAAANDSTAARTASTVVNAGLRRPSAAVLASCESEADNGVTACRISLCSFVTVSWHDGSWADQPVALVARSSAPQDGTAAHGGDT
jgi:hypothetical protein